MYFNALELWALVFSAFIFFIIFAFWLKSKKRAVISALLVVPALLVSLNGATQLITADEYQYILAFSNMQNAPLLLRAPHQGSSKNMYQYRATQMALGNLFNFLRGCGFAVDNTYRNEVFAQTEGNSNLTRFQDNPLFQVYKLAHWALCIALLTGILYVFWKWYMPPRFKENENAIPPILLGLISILLFAFPVNSLMIKVANYDGTSVYLAVLGVLLAGVYISTQNRKAAFGAVFFALLGAMEKCSSQPWYSVTVTLVIFGLLRHNTHISLVKRVSRAAAALTGIIFFCLLFNLFDIAHNLSFVNKEALDEIGVSLTPSLVVFPLTFLYQVITTGNITGNVFYVENPLIAVLSVWAAIFAAALILHAVYMLSIKHGSTLHKMVFNGMGIKAVSAILVIFIVFSIYGAYFVPVINAELIPIEEGYYVPGHTSTGRVFHYGAETKLAHIFLTLGGHYGVIISSFPTVALLLMLLTAFLLWRRKLPGEGIFPLLVMLGNLVMPVIFALGGQPQVPRYYGTVINLALICSVSLVFILLKDTFKIPQGKLRFAARSGGILLLCLFFFELSLNAPNSSPFSPIWLIRSQELNAYPKQGAWHAGEAMLWGEDFMISSKIINKHYKSLGMPDKKYELYSNYGVMSLGEKNATFVQRNITEQSFTEESWFSFSRFTLYRMPLPDFILETEPFFKIQFRGMTAAYIYRGDQLADYKDYFGIF